MFNLLSGCSLIPSFFEWLNSIYYMAGAVLRSNIERETDRHDYFHSLRLVKTFHPFFAK